MTLSDKNSIFIEAKGSIKVLENKITKNFTSNVLQIESSLVAANLGQKIYGAHVDLHALL